MFAKTVSSLQVLLVLCQFTKNHGRFRLICARTRVLLGLVAPASLSVAEGALLKLLGRHARMVPLVQDNRVLKLVRAWSRAVNLSWLEVVFVPQN